MITDVLARNVVDAWGDDGARWLADLPGILREVARDWDLTIGSPYELSYHYVTAVTCRDGTPAVLKLGVPTGSSLAEEVPALVPSRVEQLADELAMPVDRVVAWGFVKAVQSDVWTAEDWWPGAERSPISRALDVAQLLLPRLS